MRVVLEALSGPRDADGAEQLDRALLGLLLGHLLVHADRLHDLVADAVHRMEARERILEDHRDLLAPELPQLVARQPDEILPFEERSPPRPGAILRLTSPRMARFVTLFPEPDSPTMPKVSPRLDREREPVDGVNDAVRRRELDRQVLDLEQRLAARGAHWYRTLRVEVGVDDVDDQVHDDDGDCADQDDGDDHGQVRVEGRADRPTSPGPAS